MGRAPGTSSFEPLTHLQQLTGVRLDLEGLAAGRERRRRELLPDRLMPGADALLAAARSRGVATAIVTSNHRDNVLAHLARAGCEHPWDAVVCADGEPLRGKPRPTLYLEALQLLGLAAGEAVAFEDSPNGVAAAKAAGLRCLVVPNDVTRGAAGLDAGDAMLASLADFALQDE
jgi:HAD superfamily hydrolase (TIGR01509 family)